MNKTRGNAILCPTCKKLIGADEAYCPFCTTPRPGAWLRNNPATRGFDDAGRLVRTIIYVNIGMFALSVLINPWSTDLSFNPFTFFSPDMDSLLLLGATGTIPIDRFQRWWSLISANYLHGGILHLAFNMMAFRQLSPVVIREYGGHRAFAVYTLSGIAGFWASYLAGIRFTIGASAAVCGLMGALLYFGKSRGGAYGQTVYKQVCGWAVTLFVFGFLVPGINNWGHAGGLAGGILAGFVLGYRDRKADHVFHTMLAFGSAALTVAVLAWAVVTGIWFRLIT